MTEWSFETQMEAFQTISDGWAKWMSANKVQEVVVEIEAVGTRAKASSRVLRPRGLTRRPAWADNELPAELVDHLYYLPIRTEILYQREAFEQMLQRAASALPPALRR